MNKKKLLIVMGGNCMGVGGIESMVINYYRRLDKSKLQIDFVFFGEGIGLYDEEIYQNGGRIFHLPIKSKHPIKSQRMMKQLLLDRKYDIVHAHLNAAGIYSALKIAKKCNIGVRISHAHSTNHGTQSRLRWLINDHARKKIVKYTTHNFACSDKAGDWYYGSEPYTIVPNAIDTKRYIFDAQKRDALRKEAGAEGKFVIGHIGSLGYPKNQSFILETFACLQSVLPESLLWIVGDGPDRAALEAKAAELGIADKTVFFGQKNDVSGFYRAMDVFMLPSFFEGFPVVIAEAAAADLPCLVSDTVTKTVAVADNIVMKDINEGAEAWAEKVAEFSGHSRRDNTRLIIESGFDIDDQAAKLEQFYLNGRFVK